MYQMFEVMSDLMDKLKLLNYEKHFLRKHNLKSMSRWESKNFSKSL